MSTSAHSTRRLKILLVEDSELVTEQITQLLEELAVPIDIRTAQTFDDAVTTGENFLPDIAVVDLQLTRGSGFSVLRVLAKSTPRPKIVVLTNYGLPSYREFALLNGADHFLDKALEFHLLPEIVKALSHQNTLVQRSRDALGDAAESLNGDLGDNVGNIKGAAVQR